MGPKLFPAALFTTTKDWEWPKYPPAGHSLSEWGYDMQLDNHDENKDGLEYWCHSGYQDTVLSRLSEGRTVHLVCYYLNKKSFYFFAWSCGECHQKESEENGSLWLLPGKGMGGWGMESKGVKPHSFLLSWRVIFHLLMSHSASRTVLYGFSLLASISISLPQDHHKTTHHMEPRRLFSQNPLFISQELLISCQPTATDECIPQAHVCYV